MFHIVWKADQRKGYAMKEQYKREIACLEPFLEAAPQVWTRWQRNISRCGHFHQFSFYRAGHSQLVIHITRHFPPTMQIAKDCLLTCQEQACTRITRLFVRLPPCQKWPYTQENGCWLPPSDHIHIWNPFPARPEKRNNWSSKSFA